VHVPIKDTARASLGRKDLNEFLIMGGGERGRESRVQTAV